MKQVQNKGISLKGIERNTNEINVQDGACDELINLRIKDGALRPVGAKYRDPKDFLAFSGYENFTNIFKHGILPEGLFVALYSDSNGQSIVLTNTSFGINPDSFLAEASGETSEFNISASMDGVFTIITDSPSWITLSKASGTGNDTVTVTLGASDTTDRTGTITFDDGTHQFTCTVTQEGIGLFVEELTIWTDYTFKYGQVIPLSVYPSGSEFTAEIISYPIIMHGGINVGSTHLEVEEDIADGEIIYTISKNESAFVYNFVIRVTLTSYPDRVIDITLKQAPEFVPE